MIHLDILYNVKVVERSLKFKKKKKSQSSFVMEQESARGEKDSEESRSCYKVMYKCHSRNYLMQLSALSKCL